MTSRDIEATLKLIQANIDALNQQVAELQAELKTLAVLVDAEVKVFSAGAAELA